MQQAERLRATLRLTDGQAVELLVLHAKVREGDILPAKNAGLSACQEPRPAARPSACEWPGSKTPMIGRMSKI